MARVSSKYQVTVPKAIAERDNIRLVIESSGFRQAKRFAWFRKARRCLQTIPQSACECSMRQLNASGAVHALASNRHHQPGMVEDLYPPWPIQARSGTAHNNCAIPLYRKLDCSFTRDQRIIPVWMSFVPLEPKLIHVFV